MRTESPGLQARLTTGTLKSLAADLELVQFPIGPELSPTVAKEAPVTEPPTLGYASTQK